MNNKLNHQGKINIENGKNLPPELTKEKGYEVKGILKTNRSNRGRIAEKSRDMEKSI